MFEFSDILWPVVVLGAMGLLFGVGLAIASKIFAVPKDARESQVRELLAGANCGACGFPGCDGMASALVKGDATIGNCPVTSMENAAKIAAILGEAIEIGERKTACALCRGGVHCSDRFAYAGYADCRAAAMVAGGEKACLQGCIGLGTCESVCQFDALTMGEDRLPHVDPKLCTACGACAAACPRDLFAMVPVSQKAVVLCRSNDPGKRVRLICENGCIGCGLCVKACNFDAIHLEGNHAVIDFDKCKNCMACVKKCPRGIIRGETAAQAAKPKAKAESQAAS